MSFNNGRMHAGKNWKHAIKCGESNKENVNKQWLSVTHYDQLFICLLTARGVAYYLPVLPHGNAY